MCLNSETLTKSTHTLQKASSTTRMDILTGEVDGEARLGDVKVCLELYGDDVESGVDPLRQQRAAHLLQRHLVVGRPVPHLQDVVGRLGVERKKLQTGRGEHNGVLVWLQFISVSLSQVIAFNI